MLKSIQKVHKIYHDTFFLKNAEITLYSNGIYTIRFGNFEHESYLDDCPDKTTIIRFGNTVFYVDNGFFEVRPSGTLTTENIVNSFIVQRYEKNNKLVEEINYFLDEKNAEETEIVTLDCGFFTEE